MSQLWGEPLARELARGLDGTRVVELIRVEPDLDPAVHHTDLPYAIISDRHTLAIVERQAVMIDGPQLTDNHQRYVRSPTELAATRKALQRAAVWGVTAPAEQGGVADTALSIMRFLKQRGRWCVYFQGNSRGMGSYISARGGKHRWPAGMHLRAVAGGIELTCGGGTRVIASLAQLADFAAREASVLDAEVLWCQAHIAALAKLRPFGQAVLEAFTRGVPERRWELHVADEYFTRDAPVAVTVFTDETREVPATISSTGAAVNVTIGDRVITATAPVELSARVEELTAAIKAWLASPPARDMDYYR